MANQYQQQNQGKKPSLWSGLRWPIRAAIIIIPLILLGWLAAENGLIPGLSSEKSQDVAKYEGGNESVNTTSDVDMLPVPKVSDLEYADMDSIPEIRNMNWIWFGNAPMFSANGGLKTAKGSLMEKYGVNLKMTTNNSVTKMKDEQLAFIKSYAEGNKNPSVGTHFVTIMGDGAPAYISAMNKQIRKAYGKEYQLKICGIIGFSLGEDGTLGPQKWIDNPQTMKGSVVSAVIGDGDWGLDVRFCADNTVKVNPDPGTWDPNARNYVPAPEDDFLKAAEEAIAGRTVELKEKDENGKLTGRTVTKVIEGAATWFPGDRNIAKNKNMVKIISTKQYPNQMATVVVGCDQWMQDNSKTVVNFLSATLTASNQIKSHEPWFNYACELAPKVFCTSADDCSETTEDWKKFAKPGGGSMNNLDGVKVAIGGTQMANLADNMKYFGVKGGTNYYKSVYDYFSKVLKTLNPMHFMDDVDEITSYEDAVDLRYLKQVKIDAGQTTKVDYSENTGKTFAKGTFRIEFATGSANITAKGEDVLEDILASINSAENARVKIVGFTDNVGNDDQNVDLSYRRAKAVKKWLMEKSGSPSERFSVDGLGPKDPVADNSTEAGRKQNRRVEMELQE